MKNIFKKLAAFVCIMSATFALTSCESNSADSGSGVELFAFGPCPVLRGDTVIFKGSNLNRVDEIILPNSISITDIIQTSSAQIAVVVPDEAEVGYVTLNYPNGSITTQTLLSFTEPYTITSLSNVGEEMRAGDAITISGDYLNNIVKVVFGGEAAVEMENFISQSRREIVLSIPAEAISGKIYVVDGNDNQLYSDDELTIVQPTIASLTPLQIKPGSNLTITGENLDLVASVEFGGGLVVENFVSQSLTKIVVEAPATMLDGVIAITSKANQRVESTDALECIVPSAVEIAAESIYKAGNNVVISGSDLDLVTALQFAGASASEFTYADGEITVAIPNTAVDGVVTLSTAAGKSVETTAIELVKPVVVSLESIEIMSGDDIIAHGNDLDLVTAVTLAGEAMEYTYDSATGDIVVKTLLTSKSGQLTFSTTNSNSINVATVTLILDAIVSVTSMPQSAASGDAIVIEGANFNKIESMYVGDAKVTDYISRSDNSMEFVVPELEAGSYYLSFHLTTGEVETSIEQITIGVVQTRVDLWSGSHDLGAWASALELSWGNKPAAFNDMPYGATLVVEFTQTAEGQLKIVNPNGWVIFEGPAVTEWGTLVDVTSESTSFSYVYDDSVIDVMKQCGLVVQGQNCIISNVYYLY